MSFLLKCKRRYFFCGFFLCYLLFCQSCFKMRTNTKNTKAFFDSNTVQFVDQTIDFKDFKIHYIQTGNQENPTLFFVHGSPGSWDAYKDYLKDTLLLKKYRMIAVDRPGFGYSQFRKAQKLTVQAKRLVAFIEKVNNNKPIILIGHSMGGPVIAKMATLHPDLFEHLVMIAGALDPAAEEPEKWRSIIKTVPLRYLIPGALRPSNDELWWLKKDLIDMQPLLKNIRSKVTVIHGTKDQLVPHSNMSFMQKELINAKKIDTISIKNANHFIPWTHFEQIRNVLLGL
jgi:pimeloyl-ACP methyl ester carboxylesterase